MEKVTQNPPRHIALHYDGKLTKTRLGLKHEALPVMASGATPYKNRKLRDMTMLDSLTGKARAEASHDIAQKWKITDNVRARVFYTTSCNSDKAKLY